MTYYEWLKKLKFITQGLVTYMPFKVGFLPSHTEQFLSSRVRKVTDYADIAGSCYTSWFRFLVSIGKPAPLRVAEVGPGDSLGVGIAALLSGADTYYPIDRFKRDNNYDNLKLLDELLKMFNARAPIPDDLAYPRAYPRLQSYEFPETLIPNLEKNLAPGRIEKIREAVTQIQAGNATGSCGEILIQYLQENEEPPIDCVVSAATMEHVEDPGAVYRRTWNMLVPGGVFAHNAGLDCHGTAPLWNAQYTYSDFVWSLVRGRTMYLINRWPNSWHVAALKRLGFVVEQNNPLRLPSRLERKDLAAQFKDMPEDDFTVKGMFVCGYKPNPT